jgi:hypothetical protein
MDIKEMCCILEIGSVYCRVLEFVNRVLVVTVLLDVIACGGRYLQMFPNEATAFFFRVEEYY